VNLIIRNDPGSIFRFAPLQGELAKELLKEPNRINGAGSIVLIDEERYFLRSDAVLRIAKQMAWPWNLAWVFIVVPKSIRDLIYDWVARHRYNWFGKRKACMVPSEDVKARFIEVSY